MNESNKELLANYYLGFCDRRRKHFRDRWIPVSFKRILNSDTSASELLKAEIDFESIEIDRLNRFIQEEMIARVDINDYLSSLKLFKDELVNRNMFIVVNIALTTLLTKLVVDMLLPENFKNYSDVVFGVISFFVIVLLFERDGLSKRSNAASQLSVIIDKWLSENPEDVQNQ